MQCLRIVPPKLRPRRSTAGTVDTTRSADLGSLGVYEHPESVTGTMSSDSCEGRYRSHRPRPRDRFRNARIWSMGSPHEIWEHHGNNILCSRGVLQDLGSNWGSVNTGRKSLLWHRSGRRSIRNPWIDLSLTSRNIQSRIQCSSFRR